MNEPHTSHHPSIDPNHESVLMRQRAMVEAGTHPMIADRLARDAAQNQLLRERQLKLTATVVREPVVATVPLVVSEPVSVDTEDGRPDLHA